jgi:hypothetical protein
MRIDQKNRYRRGGDKYGRLVFQYTESCPAVMDECAMENPAYHGDRLMQGERLFDEKFGQLIKKKDCEYKHRDHGKRPGVNPIASLFFLGT